jgi:peptide/nickel transport system substrate-binding protein
LAALLVLLPISAHAESVLRIVPQSDLRVLDPHVTQATVTRIHALMVYDTLYALDEQLRPRMQMVGSATVSDDRLTHDFTLRDGLAFTTGAPVTSADVIASITRAAKQDPLLQLMLKRATSFQATGAKSFRLTFARPFPLVERALAANNGLIMRAEDMAAAGDTPVKTSIGSGPFRFVDSGYVAGARVLYDKNPGYIPRDEPASGMAGGKRVLVDRVEWHIIPDLQTRVAALQKGEVDLLDQLPHDGIQSLANRPDIVIREGNSAGNMAFLRMNTLQPPFNDVRARQALAMVINQTDYLSAAFTTDSTWWQPCFSFFGCGTPNSSESGSEPYRKPDPARAKALLAEAGYKGEKIVILSSQEIPLIGALAEVTGDALRKIGVNVDMQTSDWGTLVVRRARKDPAEKGGWNIFQSGIDVPVLSEPATNILVDTRCDGNNYVGWPCSEKLEAMRTAYIDDPNPAALEAYSRALWTELPTLILGQYRQPLAWRKGITGVTKGLTLAFWNIRKD